MTAVRDSLPGKTRPFAGFEWMLARRYLGSRRKETFISVISIISFIGIMLGGDDPDYRYGGDERFPHRIAGPHPWH